LNVSVETLRAGELLRVSAQVRNTSQVDSDEVVQLYVQDIEASCRVPHHELRGFTRIHLKAGETRVIEFELSAKDLSLIDEQGERWLEPGKFKLFFGGSQPDARSAELMGRAPLTATIEVVGERVKLPY